MQLRDIWRRIAFLSRRDRHLEDVEEELRLHRELRARPYVCHSEPGACG
jgi:hypothetical protein